ncbi:flagellar hook-associated protein FlgK [Cellvibrio polysaccharolyticus]|uniref:Flagellar hook-associated protein 1 n=1 Tax=Cellvibrio polysaccharolyticus TaxID=2082724 RepID=A0A928YU28_9GAMM|nr:flagellar hook-associated protein FlgK [Cellvibrio polysaccharolyticus]MBE8717614.1 flagellar hook-associated protein FlgK [Cellvibrio polysaccharolyticus]
MSGLLSTAISGLQASQHALRTAGHNISNAKTAGYTRQEVHYVTNGPQKLGTAGYLGHGVSTQSIERVVNEFVTAQVRLDTSAFQQLDKFSTNISKIDKLFADSSTGLSGGLQSFFSALQNGADDPSALPARQLIVTQAQSLAARFNQLQDRLTTVEASVTRETSAIADQISTLAQTIASLNKNIGEQTTSSTGAGPNDLLDQRDEALRKLSELVSVQVVSQDGRELNVFIGNGQPLVLGNAANSLSVRDGGQIYINGNKPENITHQLTGGQLGGVLTFREDVLHPAMNELGRIAVVISDAFNDMQSQGLDLDGDYGQPIFRDINDKSLTYERVVHGNNAQPNDRMISLKINDPSQLTASDYRFDIVPGTSNYTVVRTGDNMVVSQGLLQGSYPAEISFDGITVTLESGSFQGGDTFMLQPTRQSAGHIQSVISRPQDLAFASPIRTLADSHNSGNGIISAGEVLTTKDVNGNTLPAFSVAGQLSPPLVVRFTSPYTYDVLDNTDPANPVHLNPPIREQVFVPGKDNQVFTSDPGETRITGNGARLGLPAGRQSSPLALPANNGYPVEQYTLVTTDPISGAQSNRVVTTTANASAAQTAAMLNSLPGVSANAFTSANITDMQIGAGDFAAQTAQLVINGEALLDFSDSLMPDPAVSMTAFNDYLAQQVNGNSNLQALGIRAVSGSNAITGAPELRLVASSGVDINISMSGAPGSSLGVNDGMGNPSVALSGAGEHISVGGRVDLVLAEGVKMRTAPTDSQIFGNSAAADFAQSSFTGYQISIKGQPQAGDTFTIGFNTNASNDNRNALKLVGLEDAKLIGDGSLSLGAGYSRLVEVVASQSHLASVNAAASKSMLEQTQNLRDSISGVNLDEEAANLIRFEQMYNANARVISVARDLFDALLQAV